MSTPPARIVVTPSLLVHVAAVVLLVLAFCVAETWLTRGTFAEWLSAGLAALAGALLLQRAGH